MREQESKSLVQKKSFFSPRKVAGNGGLTVLLKVHEFFARAARKKFREFEGLCPSSRDLKGPQSV